MLDDAELGGQRTTHQCFVELDIARPLVHGVFGCRGLSHHISLGCRESEWTWFMHRAA